MTVVLVVTVILVEVVEVVELVFTVILMLMDVLVVMGGVTFEAGPGIIIWDSLTSLHSVNSSCVNSLWYLSTKKPELL
jgi:hypothetical protein